MSFSHPHQSPSLSLSTPAIEGATQDGGLSLVGEPVGAGGDLAGHGAEEGPADALHLGGEAGDGAQARQPRVPLAQRLSGHQGRLRGWVEGEEGKDVVVVVELGHLDGAVVEELVEGLPNGAHEGQRLPQRDCLHHCDDGTEECALNFGMSGSTKDSTTLDRRRVFCRLPKRASDPGKSFKHGTGKGAWGRGGSGGR